MSTATRLLLTLGLVLCGRRPAIAQEELVRVEVRVTAVAGDAVFLDRGRGAGIEPGAIVRLFPVGRPAIEGRVRSVSLNNARARLLSADGVEIGVRGEVRVPRAKLEESEAAAGEEADEQIEAGQGAGGEHAEDETEGSEPSKPGDGSATGDTRQGEPPDHPPWEHPVEGWDGDQPLLAPLETVGPEERPTQVSGRLWFDFNQTRDDASGRRRYTLARTGVDLAVANPFDQGGELQFDAETFYREVSTNDAPDDNETELQLDRLSYRVGGLRHRPHRVEVGRFLQHGFSEFGILDGVEYERRLDSGDRFGASVGFLPVMNDELKSGDDFQVAGHYRHLWGENEENELALGYQKSWHKGDSDRDLLVARGGYRPTERSSLYATAWVDDYGGDDDIKSEGLQLTQIQAGGSYTGESGSGVGLFYSHLRWPELEREEFEPVADEVIDREQLDRIGFDAWYPWSRRARLNGRFEYWEDRQDSGGSGELGVDLRDVLVDDGQVSFGAFATEGEFTSGVGLRSSVSQALERGYLTVSAESTRYEEDTLTDGNEDLLQHALRGSYDVTVDSRWDLSLFTELRFGDDQDAFVLGIYLQRRF